MLKTGTASRDGVISVAILSRHHENLCIRRCDVVGCRVAGCDLWPGVPPREHLVWRAAG